MFLASYIFRRRPGAFLIAAALFLSPHIGEATPANKSALLKFFGPHLPVELDTCATCHVRADAHGAESLEEFPHNDFGRNLYQSKGKIRERLSKVMDLDSDGDGLTNRDELLLGLSPGQAVPGETIDPAKRDEKRAAFLAWQGSYRWTPFESLARPGVPERETGGNEIDAFLEEGRRQQGLSSRPKATPEQWLRRATLNLTGIAPTPEEIEAFIGEWQKSPQLAREKAVDQLLASPLYGERWARHWMDVWRYSDWSGYKDAVRISQPFIWRWRDWIVESLNEDKGYDRMILEMLAADELAPTDTEALRATGYLVRHHDVGSRDVWLDNVVSHTAQAFLGITMGCVKCHDHMYDPIPMEEYYSMRAIFEGYHVRTDRISGELDTKKDGLVRAYARSLDPKTYLFDRGDERFPIKDRAIPPAVPAALGGDFEIEKIKLPREAWQPWRREFVRNELLEKQRASIESALEKRNQLKADATPARIEEAARGIAATRARLVAMELEFATETAEEEHFRDSDQWRSLATQTLEAQRKANLLTAKWEKLAGENELKASEKYLAQAKENKDATRQKVGAKKVATAKKKIETADKDLAAAEKALEEPVSVKYQPRQSNYPNTSNGRRLAFARWITDRSNPLTARVAINHIWLRHFGQALVPTVNEFGSNGREPELPALVDWLAAELVESGWSMKAIHRKIVLSELYTTSGTPDDASLARDPDNRYYWRMPSRRIEGEVVRDNLLAVANRIDLAMGGPEIDQNDAMTSPRRSLYFRHAHEKLVEFVQIFDGAKVAECYRRMESVQPHQALALHNSPLTHEAAREMASDLNMATSGNREQFIRLAYLSIIGREPSREESATCSQFLEEASSGRENATPRRARERLLAVLFNHNDFVTIR